MDKADKVEQLKVIADLWKSYMNIEYSPSDVAAMLTMLKVARARYERDAGAASKNGNGTDVFNEKGGDFHEILESLDRPMIRAYEDAFSQLMDKGVLDMDALPAGAREKFEKRQALRRQGKK
ncbi:DUF6378 domain-containing protein [Magnetospira sp. QH-2]|uniref:DUF6378 domain-containing protein n=1 Tax=Magnetospira sp. (strain QH-2) TaxID=1288970 RepID=UPI0003E818BD|nr:DUF6378 domain-containing protein [Magnetospira sp. QH-2]CCQ74357.1 protein of unknown function [Magnetospira sp. QH-2]